MTPRVPQTKNVDTSCGCGFKITLKVRAFNMGVVDPFIDRAICLYHLAHINTICQFFEPVNSHPTFADFVQYKQKEKEITDELRRNFEARGERGLMVEILRSPGM